MIFFAVDFMATNVANQLIPRHPISGRNPTQGAPIQPGLNSRHAGVSARPSTPQAIRRSEDVDAQRVPGMTIPIQVSRAREVQ
jgi:hypothetical protein